MTAGFNCRVGGWVVLVAGLMCPSAPALAQATPLRVEPVVIEDSGTPAIRGLVPVGWQAQGGIVWGDPCIDYGYNIAWLAGAPDKSQGIAMLAALGWGRSPIMGCRQPPIADIRDLLLTQARKLSSDVRVLDYRSRPELLSLPSVPQQIPEFSMSMPGLTAEAWRDAGELLVGWRDAQGREMRAAILGGGLFTRTVASFPATEFTPAIPDQITLIGGSDWGFAVWAQDGQLDLTASEAIRRSFQPDPGWLRFILEHRAVIDRQNVEAAGNIAEINRAGNAEVARIMAGTYDATRASQDRMYRENIEAVRGVETYVDTAGQQVQLDYNYNQAWQLDDGSYVLTNDAFYDPAAAHGIGGTQLNAAP